MTSPLDPSQNAAHVDSDEDDEQPVAESSQQGTSSKKKKKKKSKAAKVLSALTGQSKLPQAVVDRVLDKVREDGNAEATEDDVREALEAMKIMDVAQGKTGIGGINKKDIGSHKFWGTQPVPFYGEGPPIEDGYIEPSQPPEKVRQEPYPLPKDFEWATMDIEDSEQLTEVYELLSANYVEDNDASFRFKYSAEFLRWALAPPGYHKEWNIGVRVSSNKKLIAFISGVPMILRIRKNTIMASEVNFICVHKKLRGKRLAPVLIKEVTRQIHLKGIFQAIYTAGVVIPTPVSICRYNHRPLNVAKLVDVRFSYVPRNMTLARMIRVNKVSDTPTLNIREIEERDIEQVSELFKKYMTRFDMVPIWTLEEAKHQLLSGKGTGNLGDNGPGRRVGQVTWTYVVEDEETHKITDFFSFYSLPSTIINNTKYPVLEAAYLYYYASDRAFGSGSNDELLIARLRVLISDAIVVANNAKFDVFNALTLMDNIPLLEDLKFGLGDGHLHFYLYNWRTAPLAGIQAGGSVPAGRGVGVVML